MNKTPAWLDRMSVKEQAAFARRLSFLIQANVPLLEALTILSKQSRTAARKKMFDQIIHDVSNGQTLSSSLEKFRHLFGNFSVDIIRIGEEGGMLDSNLNYLADELQKKQTLQRKIMGALTYPLVVTVATLGITGLIVVYIFPKILPVFKTIHVALPPTTRALIFLSDLLIHHGLLIFSLVAGSIVGIIVLIQKVRSARRFTDRCIMHAPIFGALMRSYYLTNFCRTFGLLLKSHFGVVRASQVTAETASNMLYREELQQLTDEIARGRSISEHLAKRTDLFPNMVGEMVAIGEKTGNLSGTLLYLAGYYENEVDETTKNLSSSLEPILMVVMGIIVGFIAVSVITPIYAITQNLHH